MPAQLTPEQRTAIETRDVSVALSAGAGCGKTFVLTQRFISHLKPKQEQKEPARLGQLIAITFTDAAAREMRDRIRRTCYEQLTQSKTTDEQTHWLRLLREIDAARVSTIHSFCASLLRKHAAAADLDPLFGVLDQSDADVLQLEVIDDTLREQLASLDPDTLELASAYGLLRLKEQISALVGHRHDESFDQWLDATPDRVVAAWREWHKEKAFPLALREIAAVAPVRALQEQLREVPTTGRKPQFVEARATLLELLPRLQKCNVTLADVQLIRESAKVQGICSAKDWESADHYGCYRDACKVLRDAVDEYLPKPFSADAARVTAQLGLNLLRLSKLAADNYEHRKRARSKLDFDDLLSAAYKFLNDPKNAALRDKLSDELQLLLVDEFQDTDQLQAKLVKSLCGPGFDTGRLFFVGDFKQSIYRFRGAEPKVFRDLREDVKERGRLPLTLNFRSQPGILNFVNALFHEALGSEHEDYQALRASREQTTAVPCVEFLWTATPEKNSGIAGAALAARREEALAIARRLRSLIDATDDERPIVDKATNKPRPLALGDVAILFRTLSDVQVYEEALREYDLDYYLVGGHAFYAQQEIYDVLNLLRSVASTADEVSLAGVLRSPFFSLTDEALFWLADSAGSLNAGLLAEKLPAQLSPEELTKTIAAADTIRQLRVIKDRVPIASLLAEALDRTGYDAVLLAEFLGQRKLANLHKLMERARAADQSGILDLDGFITQLAQFIAHQPKEALAATLPEAADVIRLMTIHHAKGLEFPLVVLPDLDRTPRFGTPPAMLHPEFGPLVPAPPDDEDQKNVATGMSICAAIEKSEELEERKRLLYVACTRAADHLILSSSVAGFCDLKSDWLELLAERFNLESGQLLATLPSNYDAPDVGISPAPSTSQKPAGRTRGPDLLKLLDEAHDLAASDQGIIPPSVAPIPVDHTARRQFSFSSLGHLKQVTPQDDQRAGASPPPISLVAPGTTARPLGTLVHEVLARIDFAEPGAVEEWCEHLASELVPLNAGNAARTASDLVKGLLKSPRGRQLAGAAAVHREVEFMLAWPPDGRAANAAYLRGYIDCLYQDAAGRIILLDYKTDNISAADVPHHANRYAMQLYVYALATEQAIGQSPSDLALYFLRPAVEFTFPWNAAAREECIRMVNESIALQTAAVNGQQAQPRSAEKKARSARNRTNTRDNLLF